MSPVYRSFLRRLLFTTLVIVLAGGAFFVFFLPVYYQPAIPFLLLFVVFFTWITFTWLVKSSGKGTGHFIRTTMAITLLRLLVFGSLAVAGLLVFPKNRLTFVITLVVFYLLYTILEITEITRILQKKKPES